MNVTRVQDATGDHIEPPLDEAWDDFTKLRWHAEVTALDSGLKVHVEDGALRDDNDNLVPGWYGVTVGRTGSAAFDFRSAWTYLNGVGTGGREAGRLPAATAAASAVTGTDDDYCGSEPPMRADDPESLWGDCWCTRPTGHDGDCLCEPCGKRGAPGWPKPTTDAGELEPTP